MELQGSVHRWAGAAAVFCAALLAWAPVAQADRLPAGSSWSEAYLTSRDGTRLHADVFRPATAAADARTPVMLVVSPYLGLVTPEDPGPPKVLDWYRAIYEEAIARGYSVVQVSFRGTGASQGCSDFGGPGEQGDVATAIDWAAGQPWSTGRVGMLGHSYDGFAGVIALSQRPGALAAAVLAAPAVDLYRGIYMNGVAYAQGRGVTPYYQAFALIPPLTGGPDGTAGAITGRDLSCAARLVRESQNGDPSRPFWRDRDFTARASGSDVPVLWSHGFLDGRDDFSATRPDNFLGVWRTLTGPRRAWFGQFPHLVPGANNSWNEPEPVGRDGFPAEALDWLDAYVKQDAGALTRTQAAPPVLVQDGSAGTWRGEQQWPAPGARPRSMALVAGTYSDSAGNKAEQGDGPGGSCTGLHARCNPNSRTGQGAWTFSQPLGADVRLAGVTRIALSLTGPPSAQAVAIVYDVDPQNRAALLTRGASVVGADGRAEFDLYPQDWRLRAGHRVGVLITGSDDIYFTPGTTGAQVRVDGGTLTLPLATDPQDGPLEGGPSRAVAERTTFPVDPRAVGASLSVLRLPAAAQPRLKLRVRPRRAVAGLPVVVRASVTDARGNRVPRALIRIGRRLVRTGRGSTARVVLRFTRTGRRTLRATKPGYRRARAALRVAARSRR